ncbi:MAG TPA: dihydrofolate reductase family protein [Prolixibacteraceae bacterium]|nr:dihydrofolate reductase family protein [Prolixibacteraceae bacterium]
MRKLIFFMHTSLDNFVAGLNGEMDWIKVDDEIFDFVGTMTDDADTALYGRVTYQMMEAYWPDAGNKPGATKHDKEHSTWYNKVPKIVLSKTLNESALKNTRVISENITENINAVKQKDGKNIIIFGSPSASNTLLRKGLVDEFWIFLNPILLGQGIPLFTDITETIPLNLVETKTFNNGVIALHYKK